MKLAKQFLIYGVGGAASRLAAVVLVPLYTRTLSISDYGQLEVLLAVHTLAVLVAGLQSESAAARDFYDARDRASLKGLAWNTLVMTAAGSTIVAACMWLTTTLGLLPDNLAHYLPLLLAMSIPAQILGIQMVLLRFAAASVLFATLSFLDLALAAVLSAVFIVGFDLGILGGLYGILCSKTICVALAWPRTFGRPAGLSREGSLKNMIAYAIPTMPSVLLNWLQTNGNRILLALTLTLSDVAITGIAIKVAALYGFLVYTFRLAWEPYSFEMLAEHAEPSRFYSQALQWYVTVMFCAGVFATIASPTIVGLLAPRIYQSAAELAGFFIIGQFWAGAITILAIGIHGARVTSRLTLVYGIGAVLNVILLLLLAKHVGSVAAAAGFMVSSVASAALATHYSDRHFNIGFDRRLIAYSMLASTAFAAAAFAAATRFEHEPLLAAVSTAGAGLLASATIAVLGFRSYPAAEMWTDLRRFARPASTPR